MPLREGEREREEPQREKEGERHSETKNNKKWGVRLEGRKKRRERIMTEIQWRRRER